MKEPLLTSKIVFGLLILFQAQTVLGTCFTSGKPNVESQFEILSNIPAYHGCPNLQEGRDVIIRVSVPGCFLMVRDTKLGAEGEIEKVYTKGDPCKWKWGEVREMTLGSPCCRLAEYSCNEGPPPSSYETNSDVREIACATQAHRLLYRYPYKANGTDFVESYDLKSDRYITRTKKEVQHLEQLYKMHRRVSVSGNPKECNQKFGPEEYIKCLKSAYDKIAQIAVEKKNPELCLPVKNYPKENSTHNPYQNCIRDSALATKSLFICKRYLKTDSLAEYLGKCLSDLKASEKNCTILKTRFRDRCYFELASCTSIQDSDMQNFCWSSKSSLYLGRKKEFIKACGQNFDCYQNAKPDSDEKWAYYIETISESGLSTHHLNTLYQDASKAIYEKDPDLALSLCKRLALEPKSQVQKECIQNAEFSKRRQEFVKKMKLKYPDFKPFFW